jgi:hypothetical protein
MQRERIEQYIEMYEEVQNSEDRYNVRWLSYICSSKTKIESTTVQYSWQCTVILLRVQYI